MCIAASLSTVFVKPFHIESSVALALALQIFPQFFCFFSSPLDRLYETDSSKQLIHFIMEPFAQLPMLFSDSLLYFSPLKIFKHAGFLLRPIGLYPGNSCLSRIKLDPLI